MPVDSSRSAAAKRGWETRRRREREKLALDMERASSPPPFFPSETRVGLGTGPGVSPQLLLAQVRSWQAIAVRAIADRMMALEPVVFMVEREAEGTIREDELDDHPLKFLLDNPNPNFTRMQTMRLLSMWLSQVGDAYLLKVTDSLGVVRELHPFSPANVELIVGEKGIVGYVHRSQAGETRYTKDEVIRIFNPDPYSPFDGVGNLSPQALSYDTGLFLDQTLRRHYRDDATPKTVITANEKAQLPNKETRERWHTEWLNSYHRRTGGKVGLPVFLPPGFEIQVLESLELKDLVPLLDHYRDKILSANGVPGPLVGLDKNINRATARAAIDIFEKNVIEPQASLIADALTAYLAKDFDPRLRVRFKDIVSKDQEFELRQEQQDLTLFVKPINEVRKGRGLDPVEWGDEPLRGGSPNLELEPTDDESPAEPQEERR